MSGIFGRNMLAPLREAERCEQYSAMYDTVYKNSKNIENELHFKAKN